MNLKTLHGMKLSLVSDSKVEDFRFNGDRVAAVFGQKDGPVCAPILKVEVLGPPELKLQGAGFEILWSHIEINGESVSLLRNGIPQLYTVLAL